VPSPRLDPPGLTINNLDTPNAACFFIVLSKHRITKARVASNGLLRLFKFFIGARFALSSKENEETRLILQNPLLACVKMLSSENSTVSSETNP